jgi:hypothetical protein
MQKWLLSLLPCKHPKEDRQARRDLCCPEPPHKLSRGCIHVVWMLQPSRTESHRISLMHSAWEVAYLDAPLMEKSSAEQVTGGCLLCTEPNYKLVQGWNHGPLGSCFSTETWLVILGAGDTGFKDRHCPANAAARTSTPEGTLVNWMGTQICQKWYYGCRNHTQQSLIALDP